MKKTLKEQILELKEKGYSYNQIKEQLGCSKGTIAYHIGIGQKNKTIERNSNKRNKIVRFIQEYKAGKKCADCGENYPYWILEFDHLQDKDFTIAQFRSTTMSLDIVKEEIKKCDVVCSNCHKNRTFNRSLKTLDGVGFEHCKYPE
jgi:DNA-binding MarR family transcriptional regulator